MLVTRSSSLVIFIFIFIILSITVSAEMVSRRDMVPTAFDGEFSLDYRNDFRFRKFETVRKRGSKFEKSEFLLWRLYY